MMVCLEVSAGQRFITFTEHMLLNRSLLEIVSLTQKNAPTGGILAPWLVDISPPPRLYQRVLSLVVPSSVSAQESAQGHWSHTAVVNGLWELLTFWEEGFFRDGGSWRALALSSPVPPSPQAQHTCLHHSGLL